MVFFNMRFIDNKVNHDIFLQFILYFGLFNNEQILKLLLYVSGIQSNVVISNDQMFEFLRDINMLQVVSLKFRSFLDETPTHENKYHIKDFKKFVMDNDVMQPLFILRKFIIEEVITVRIYTNILYKKDYYGDREMPPLYHPTECFLKAWYRKFFLQEPHPLLADFTPSSYKVAVDNIIYIMCTKYSPIRNVKYSERPRLSSSTQSFKNKSSIRFSLSSINKTEINDQKRTKRSD